MISPFSSSTLSALVLRAWTLDPASGSVTPYATISPSSAILFIYLSFCSGVPPTLIGSIPRHMARNDVAMARSIFASLSETMAISMAPAPSPPYSAGIKIRWRATSGPSIKRISSIGKAPSWSISSLVSRVIFSFSSLDMVSRTMERTSGSIFVCPLIKILLVAVLIEKPMAPAFRMYRL